MESTSHPAAGAPPRAPRGRGFWIALFAGYAAMLAGVCWGLVSLRAWSRDVYDRPEAQRDWEKWKADVATENDAPGPATRRPIKAGEPPALVLVRDHFVAIVITTLAMATFLYAFLAFVVRGAFFRPTSSQPHGAGWPDGASNHGAEKP